MSDTEQTEIFVQQLAECQGRLFGYVYSMLGEHSRAMDVVQETNLVLWRKKADFREGAPFMPWALAIARFQVLAHVRDQGRDKCLLDTELVAVLSDETERQVDQLETMRIALRRCMSDLPREKMELLRLRYYRAMPIAEIAKSMERKADAVKVALLRVRRRLPIACTVECRRVESWHHQRLVNLSVCFSIGKTGRLMQWEPRGFEICCGQIQRCGSCMSIGRCSVRF